MPLSSDGSPPSRFRPSPGALLGLLLAWLVQGTPPSQASPVGFDATATGVNGAISVHADLTASGNLVTLTLTNDGAPTASKAEVLTSFYMKIITPAGKSALTLTPNHALGSAYQLAGAGSGKDDVAASWAVTSSGHYWRASAQADTASDLFAFKNYDQGWQAKSFSAAGSNPQPQYNFGIGTVGNSGLSSAGVSLGFSGNVVKGPVYPGGSPGYTGVPQIGSNYSELNLGIYSVGKAGDPGFREPSLLTNVLVRRSATFIFDSSINFGTDGALLDAYVTEGMFAFGTAPDGELPGVRHLPEPGTLPMVATFAGGALGWSAWRRRMRRRG